MKIDISKTQSIITNTLPTDSEGRNIVFGYNFAKPLKNGSGKIILNLTLEYILLNGAVSKVDDKAGSLKLKTKFTINSHHTLKDSMLLLHECTKREIEYFKTLFFSMGIKGYPTESIFTPNFQDCEPILKELYDLDFGCLS